MIPLALEFDWSVVLDNREEWIEGLKNTLEVSAIAIAGSFVIGLVLGAARAHRIPVLSQLAACYVELIRNTPLLVQVFFIFFGLPQLDIRLDPFTAAWVSVMIWGGAFNTENFRAGFQAVPFRYREAGFALGFGRLATFFNVTLPIGGRIALPSSINTYVSVLKNTAILGPAIGFAELTNTAYNLESILFQPLEIYAVLALTYLVIVWVAVDHDPGARGAPAPARGGAMSFPDWLGPVLDYMFSEGLRGTLIISVESVAASAIVGVVLGTLMTVRFWPLRALIRLYIELWRGLPIIVTIFLIFFALPSLDIRFSAFQAAAIGLSLWGSAQVAEATRGAVESIPREQHEASAALGFGWLGRHVYVILPQARRRLLPPMVSLLVNVIQNSTLAALIGALELLESGKRQVERLAAPPPVGEGEIYALQIYAILLVIFFCISFPLTRLAAYLERRLV